MLGVCYSIEGVDGVGLVPVALCSPYKLGTFGSSSTSDYAICAWSVRSSSSSSSSSRSPSLLALRRRPYRTASPPATPCAELTDWYCSAWKNRGLELLVELGLLHRVELCLELVQVELESSVRVYLICFSDVLCRGVERCRQDRIDIVDLLQPFAGGVHHVLHLSRIPD